MIKIKDKKIYVLIGVLLIFTIGYFAFVINASYAFDNNYDTEAAFKQKVKIIKEVALVYGEQHLDDFSDEGILYIDIQTLIDNQLLAPDNDGNIVNFNNNEVINDNKIRLKYEDEKMSAELYN